MRLLGAREIASENPNGYDIVITEPASENGDEAPESPTRGPGAGLRQRLSKRMQHPNGVGRSGVIPFGQSSVK